MNTRPRSATERELAVGRRVLVVEDHAASRFALRALLEQEGFTIETAASAEEALTKLQDFDPQLLLVDLRLPEMDGVAFAGRAREWSASLPVVLMSGFDASHGPIAAWLREPRTAHVLKPIDMDALAAAFERAHAGIGAR